MLNTLDDANHVDRNLQGIVYKKAVGIYTVRADGRTMTCTLANRLRKQITDPTTDPVAVGDRVNFSVMDDGSSFITEILPRKNKLSRPAIDGARRIHTKPPEQIIVANIDQVVIVMPAANPAPHWELLDRYLATAEAADLPAVICLTKIDLMKEDVLSKETEVYRKIGYPVILTSAVGDLGIDQVKAALQDRISMLWGKSGVGKTTLLNAIQPGLGLRVNEVNAHNSEGRHTTSSMEMFDLAFGGSVIDTPGQRKFKLWEDDIIDFAQLLPEMRPFIGQCRFGVNCSHVREPGCAIRAAVSSEQISQRRYKSFLGMREYFSD